MSAQRQFVLVSKYHAVEDELVTRVTAGAPGNVASVMYRPEDEGAAERGQPEPEQQWAARADMPPAAPTLVPSRLHVAGAWPQLQHDSSGGQLDLAGQISEGRLPYMFRLQNYRSANCYPVNRAPKRTTLNDSELIRTTHCQVPRWAGVAAPARCSAAAAAWGSASGGAWRRW
jgi:hypothetical protein